MHLKSISMKGFKSFPDRTKLEFSPGVAVVVGPNGSGKSNITDAVLWALGEQSPLAVRGQSMKDVIFAGGHGVKGSTSAEVEVVIDNEGAGAGGSSCDFSEISIVRRLGRDGEGEYRLNGARCRLADIVEVLSDTGLGKEMHSVVSQGRVEAIVLSRPRDRRLLIEEAAGLGKHRKRRRSAQLKLERTEENLSRALDVEREARTRLRPLKRQAEAAQLHERLERQMNEARYELARDAVRAALGRLATAEGVAAGARAARDEGQAALGEVARRREAAEEAFAALTRSREDLDARLYAARSAGERIAMRQERARDQARAAAEGGRRRHAQLEVLERELAEAGDPADGLQERLAALESELAALDGEREERVRDALEGLGRERAEAEQRRGALEAEAASRREELAQLEAAAEAARRARHEAERAVESARAEAAAAGAELAAVNQYLRSAAAPANGESLADAVDAEPGYELALAAALGAGLGARVVESIPEGERVLDTAGEEGATVLVRAVAGGEARRSAPPSPRAEPLLGRLRRCEDSARAAIERLLADVWLVDSLDGLDGSFTGTAVTRTGRVWRAGPGELRQAPAGGAEAVLEKRNRRAELVAASEASATATLSAAAVSSARARGRGRRAPPSPPRGGGCGRGGVSRRLARRAAA